jgi:hypothetical protein
MSYLQSIREYSQLVVFVCFTEWGGYELIYIYIKPYCIYLSAEAARLKDFPTIYEPAKKANIKHITQNI